MIFVCVLFLYSLLEYLVESKFAGALDAIPNESREPAAHKARQALLCPRHPEADGDRRESLRI